MGNYASDNASRGEYVMGKSRVRITDGGGKSFDIVIDISYFGKFTEGTFEVQTTNYIAYDKGVCKKYPLDGVTAPYTSLEFFCPPTGEWHGPWGMRLFDWDNLMGVNSGSTGFIQTEWARRADPGRIKWTLIS
jgi:hypothetical protein